MPFGFDPANPVGFDSPTFNDLLLDAQAKYFAETGILVDLEVKSPDLGFLRTLARMLKGTYDDQFGTYSSAYVGQAAGVALRNLLFPLIGDPLPDSFSEVLLPVTGTPLTTIGVGSAVTLDLDGPGGLQWVLTADINLDGGGLGSGTFRYVEAGPKSAAALSSWSIATPLGNWSTVGTNAAAAVEGRLAETDAEYRQRAQLSAEQRRLFAAVSAVDGVTALTIFENQTDIPDAFWGATHWVEVLVQGGDDAEIAAAIQSARCSSVQTVGNVSVVTPAPGFAGGTVVIRFSRPALVDVFVDLTIVKGEAYSPDTSAAAVLARETAIKDQIVAFGAARPVGLDLTAFQVATAAAQTPSVPGIGDIAPALIAAGAPPGGGDTAIIAGPRDLLVIAAVNIVLAGV